MLYHASLLLRSSYSVLNLFHYITFRAGASLLTALLLSLMCGPWFIRFSARYFSSAVRQYTPENHQQKGQTPIMGGLLIIGVVMATLILWANWCRPVVWIMALVLICFGAIGFFDDWRKVRYRKGISARMKFWLQVSAGMLVIGVWQWFMHPGAAVWFPFFKHVHPDLGWFFVIWALFVIIGTCNAVNLTDGLDGLASTSLIANFMTFSIIAYCAGHVRIANYLAIPFANTAELFVVGAALVGAVLGFLWFNTFPAQIFMGDVGSLALGSALAMMALMVKQELLLVISGGLFVLEALSVIIQVLSFKLRGKRVFKMAPLHHHYEMLGWPEAKITIRFGIISFILCLLVLMTLKVR